ncbi:hypothetical protein [Aquabacterium sp.]|uniref:hypothetical protein n=1 Tax=Aquabacterium sp. TaxID=1872578 RepID=UPI0019BF7171|nr:hypothetical protein [Aquabacterium sp.]MBC7699190.1 hypothetical protein [Aquabacterium sp.]
MWWKALFIRPWLKIWAHLAHLHARLPDHAVDFGGQIGEGLAVQRAAHGLEGRQQVVGELPAPGMLGSTSKNEKTWLTFDMVA